MSGLPLLQPGDSVKMLLHPDARHRIPGVIEAHHNSPRSYVVRTTNNVYRQNKLHLRSVTPSANVDPLENQPPSCSHVSPDVNDVLLLFLFLNVTPQWRIATIPQVPVCKHLNPGVSQQCLHLESLHHPETPRTPPGAAGPRPLPDVWIFF